MSVASPSPQSQPRGYTAPTRPPQLSRTPAGLGNHCPHLCSCPKPPAQQGSPRPPGGQNAAGGGRLHPQAGWEQDGGAEPAAGRQRSPGPSHRQPFEAWLWAAFARGPGPPGHPLQPRTPGHPLPPRHGGRDSPGAVQTPLGTGPTPVSKSTCRHRLPPPDFPPAPWQGVAETTLPTDPHCPLPPPAPTSSHPHAISPGSLPPPAPVGRGQTPRETPGCAEAFGVGYPLRKRTGPPESPDPQHYESGAGRGSPMLKTPQLHGDTVFPYQAALGRAGRPQGLGCEVGGAKIPPMGPTSTCHTHTHGGSASSQCWGGHGWDKQPEQVLGCCSPGGLSSAHPNPGGGVGTNFGASSWGLSLPPGNASRVGDGWH